MYIPSRLAIKVIMISIATIITMIFTGYLFFSNIDNDKSAILTASECMTGPDEYNRRCLLENWVNAAQNDKLANFIDNLDSTVEQNPGIGIACHDEAHYSGFMAFKAGIDPMKLILEGSSKLLSCDNGFVHGVIGAFARNGATEQDLPMIFETCLEIDEPARRSCVHGSGHAVWAVVEDVVKSTTTCVKYKSNRDIGDCIAGVLMTMLSPMHEPGQESIYSNDAEALMKFPSVCEMMYATDLVNPELVLCMFPLGEFIVNREANARGGVFNNVDQYELIKPVLDASIQYCNGVIENLIRECKQAVYQAVARHITQQSEIDKKDVAHICENRDEIGRLECVTILDLAYSTKNK